jgi:hypothetical protein
VFLGNYPGYFCFGSLPFVPRGGEATIDSNSGGAQGAIAVIGLGGPPAAFVICPVGTQVYVDIRNTLSPPGFFMTLYH